MIRAATHAPVGTIGWTESTGGVLSAGEQLSLAPALLDNLVRLVAGRVALATRTHPGRRNAVAPDALTPPGSPLVREAEATVQDLLTPALLNHSRRAFAWGAALAALDDIAFDRELLYLAALFHDTGLPSPTPNVDFTVRSAELAREFTDRHQLPAGQRELVTNAIALHHTPGVTLDLGPEAFLLSAGAAVDVFGLRSEQLPDTVRRTVVQEHPRVNFKREFAALLRAESHQVPHGRAWYLHRFALSSVTIRLAPFHG